MPRKNFVVPDNGIDPEALKKVHTKQRGESWGYYFEKAKVDGKRQREQERGFPNEQEALAAGLKAYTNYVSGNAIAKKVSISVADYMDIWYERTKLRARNNTLEMREKNIRLHIKPDLGSYRLTSLSPDVIDAWVIKLRKGGYAYETTGRYLGTLSTALDYAIWPMKLLRDNPARFVKVPGDEVAPLTTTPPRRRLDNNELATIFKRYPFGDSYHMPYAIGLYFASRISETICATWDNCDIENLQMAFMLQIQRLTMKGKHSFYYVCDLKTKTSHRILKFDNEIMLPLLKRWKKKQAENEISYGEDYYYNYLIPAKDFQGRDIQRIVSLQKRYDAPGPRINIICTQPNGEYVKPASLAYTFSVLRKLGIHGFNFHCMRHTNLTMLSEGHAVDKDIMSRAGHSDYKTTMRYYIEDQPTMQDESVQILTEKINSIL